MDIQSILQSSENHYRSFLPHATEPETIAKDMVAFSNMKGGEIVVGVDKPNSAITGINARHDLEKIIRYAAAKLCHPVISPIIQFYTIESKIICFIEILIGANKPYCLRNSKDFTEIYVRSGSKTILTDSKIEKELLRQGKNIIIDYLPVQSLSCNIIDKQSVKHYLRLINHDDMEINEPNLEKLGILTSEKNKYFPTVGGLLLFSKRPQSVPRLRQAEIKCAKFQGVEMGKIKVQAIFSGPLHEQINSAMDFIGKNIADLDSLENSNYPLNAIGEAIINAVIHRDYFYAIVWQYQLQSLTIV